MSKLLKKKSQIWYLDFVIALSLFTLFMIFSFKYITDTTIIQEKETHVMLDEADTLSEALMSEGVPINWTVDYVNIPGIITSNQLNLTKLDNLGNLTIDDYDNVRNILSIESEFIVYFQNKTDVVSLSPFDVGKPGFDLAAVQAANPEEIVHITRYVTYKHDNIAEIIAMEVVLWRIRAITVSKDSNISSRRSVYHCTASRPTAFRLRSSNITRLRSQQGIASWA